MDEKKERVRSERSDKKIHVNSCYLKSTHDKMVKLAMSCGITKTKLQTHLVELCLNNENIVNYVQDQFKDTSHFRIIPTKLDGELRFVFAERLSAKK